MKKLLCILAGIVIGIGSMAAIGAKAAKPAPTVYEYLLEGDYKKLNSLGAEGWRVVATPNYGTVSYLMERPKNSK